MAVIRTEYTPLNSDQYDLTPEEQKAQYEEATADLSNALLTEGIDLSGLSGLSAGQLFNENQWREDMGWNDYDHLMNEEHFRSGGGMDNAYNSGYTGHNYIGEDGRRYRKIVYVDQANDRMVTEYTDERMYRWSPSDEHKRTHRDDDVLEAAYGKEFSGGAGSGWYTEEEIRGAWDAGDMHQMQEQGVTWDQYWGYVTGIDELVHAGELDYKDASGWMQNESYVALVNSLGIPMQFDSRGDVYNFNGFGYSRDYWSDKSDAGPIIKMAMAAAISWAAGPALVGAFQGAGMSAAMAKAASATVISTTQQYMTTGKLSLEDALMSAALAYGGAEFSDALQGSGVVGEIGSKVTEFGEKIAEGGGDVLSAAMQAGGISLVSQLVQEGEIDWKDAAMAAAMAGGTVVLVDFLSGIGKSGAEGEVLEEIKVTAKHKGTLVGEDMYQLEDGTVIYAPAEGNTSVLGNMSTLDLDGDGQLTGNDLQEIQANNYEYKDPSYSGANNTSSINLLEETPRVGSRVYMDADGNLYTQDQIGRYVDGGLDGRSIYKVDGVDTPLSEGQIINGRYMFDINGDGAFDEVYNMDGALVGTYDPEIMAWRDYEGNASTKITEYMEQIGVGGESIENAFEMSKEYYADMSAERMFDDVWARHGEDGVLSLSEGELRALAQKFEIEGYDDAVTGEKLWGHEALERYLQREGVGIHYTDNGGWKLESGVDTSEGIYGINYSDRTIAEVLGAPEDPSGTNYSNADYTPNKPELEDPFTDPPQQPDNTNSNSPETGETGTPTNPVDSVTDGSPTSTTPSTNPTPTDSTSTANTSSGTTVSSSSLTPSQIATIATLASTSVQDVIERLDSGETVESIIGNGSTPVTPSGTSDGTSDASTTPSNGETGSNDTTGSTDAGTTDTSGSTDTGVGTDDGGSTDNGTDDSGTTDTGSIDNGGTTDTGSTGSDNTSGNPDNTNNTDTNGTTDNTGTTDTSTNTTTDTSGNTTNTGTNTNTGTTSTNDGTGDTGTGPGTGDEGTGPGDGPGGVGFGGGGMLGGIGGGSTPQWGELFPMHQFVARPKNNSQKRASLFADLLSRIG